MPSALQQNKPQERQEGGGQREGRTSGTVHSVDNYSPNEPKDTLYKATFTPNPNNPSPIPFLQTSEINSDNSKLRGGIFSHQVPDRKIGDSYFNVPTSSNDLSTLSSIKFPSLSVISQPDIITKFNDTLRELGVKDVKVFGVFPEDSSSLSGLFAKGADGSFHRIIGTDGVFQYNVENHSGLRDFTRELTGGRTEISDISVLFDGKKLQLSPVLTSGSTFGDELQLKFGLAPYQAIRNGFNLDERSIFTSENSIIRWDTLSNPSNNGILTNFDFNINGTSGSLYLQSIPGQANLIGLTALKNTPNSTIDFGAEYSQIPFLNGSTTDVIHAGRLNLSATKNTNSWNLKFDASGNYLQDSRNNKALEFQFMLEAKY